MLQMREARNTPAGARGGLLTCHELNAVDHLVKKGIIPGMVVSCIADAAAGFRDVMPPGSGEVFTQVRVDTDGTVSVVA